MSDVRDAAVRMTDGVAATPMLQAILERLLDDGPATTQELTDVVSSVGSLAMKADRLRTTYGDPLWPPYVADGLTVLSHANFVHEENDRWELGPEFVHGKLLVALKAGGGIGAVRVMARPAAERIDSDVLDRDRLTVAEVAETLQEGRPGLRPLNSEHVERLAESMRTFGYMAAFPVLVDQHGRILDGRHRIAAAKAAGATPTEQEIKVSGEREAVGIAWASGINLAWNAQDHKRVTQMLGGRKPYEVLGLRLAVKLALTANHRISNRELGRLVGADHKGVKPYRDALEAAGEVPVWDADAEIRELKAAHPGWSARDIAKAVGVSHPTVTAVLGGKIGESPQFYHPGQSASTSSPAQRSSAPSAPTATSPSPAVGRKPITTGLPDPQPVAAPKGPPEPPRPLPPVAPKSPTKITDWRESTSTAQPHVIIRESDRNDAEFLSELLIRTVITDVDVMEQLGEILLSAARTARKLSGG